MEGTTELIWSNLLILWKRRRQDPRSALPKSWLVVDSDLLLLFPPKCFVHDYIVFKIWKQLPCGK